MVIVGGGIAGVLAGANLRRRGVERIRIIDQAGGIGGTWYWNRYPGVMCDVESYIYMPMLEELGYVPSERYASGEEIRRHLEAIAERFELTDDALFHTGVTRAEWDEGAARWRVGTDREDEISCRFYVLAVGILNLMKLPAIPGMERFAGPAFHTARWDYGVTGGGPGQALTKLGDSKVALIGTGATGIQVLPPLAAAAEHVYVFQRTPSAIGVRGNRRTAPSFAEQLRPGWQQDRMDNFQAIMLGRPVDEDLTDDGWTDDYAASARLPRPAGMSTAEYLRAGEEVDFGIMEAHRQRVSDLVADPGTAEILKPWYRYLCKRPCFHDEYLQAFNQRERHADRLPGRHRGDHRPGAGGRWSPVRGRLHRVRDRVRGGAHPAATAGRPRHRRPRRAEPGREVGRRRLDAVRDDESRLPQPVRDAGARPAGRRHRELHPARGARRGVHRPPGGDPRRALRASLRCRGASRGGMGERHRRRVRRWQRTDVGVHTVAAEPGGPPRSDEPTQRQLRRSFRRLLRLPRPAGEVARVRRLRRSRAGRGEVSAALSRLDRPVAVVTGGGGGIGGAVAEELGRAGHFVVTVDPLVTVDGAEQMPPAQETTAGRIVAAGGAARASSVSVADRDGVRELFAQLADEFGRVDAVVNVAGITRPSTFARGADEDWRSVLDVHLGGYLNILEAALPIMAEAGRGTILGVTSGAGWRAADAGAYSCAKRAVAALTWQLGRVAPPGVVVNAMSPIAATRMVAAALERARGRGPSAASGGLSLDSMPSPEELGPIGAHLVTWDPPTCRGQVIFVGGSEVAVIDRPRLLEVFRTEAVSSISHLLETATSVFAQAESDQTSSGGSNPRFGTLFDVAGATPAPGPVGRRCAVVSDRPELVGAAERIARRTRMGLRTGAGRWRRPPRVSRASPRRARR